MRNNKGMSIVEIIVAVALVAIVLVFMINLLITIKSSSDASQNRSDALINRALLVREIEKDFTDFTLTGIDKCTINEISGGVRAIIPSTANNVYCLKLTYQYSTSDGYLIQYTDSTKKIVGYKRGTNQIVRESPYQMNPTEEPGTVKSSCSSYDSYSNCSLVIVMPVTDEEKNDFSIRLSYIYPKSSFTYTSFSKTNGFVAY